MAFAKSALAAAALMALTTEAGNAQSRDYEFDSFDALNVATGINAVVTQGELQSVRVEYKRPDVFDKLEIGVDGGELHARIEENFFDFILGGGLVGKFLQSGEPQITLYVTVPSLNRIEASSSADVAAEGLVAASLDLSASSAATIALTAARADRLAASASSAGEIRLRDAAFPDAEISASTGASVGLTGSCERLLGDASTGARIDASALDCTVADVGASSGGNVLIRAIDSVQARASTGGRIDVYGNPGSLDADASTGGDVERVPG